MQIQRRQLLALIAAVPMAGSLGVGTLAFRWWDRPPGAGLLALSPHEYDIVQSIAEAWMPPGGTPKLSGADADLGSFFDEIISHMADLDRTLLKLLLQALDDSTLLTDFGTYTTLPLHRRSEVLYGWIHSEHSMMRSAVSAFLVLMSTGWTTHPEVASLLRPMFPCGFGRGEE